MQPIAMAAVGDISLGEHYFQIGHGPQSVVEKEGGDYLLANIRNSLQKSDFAFGNLETVLSETGLDAKNIQSRVFRGHPTMASKLRDAGFSVLNIANNHILQHGPDAFADTLQILHNAGIAPLGLINSDEGLISQPVFMTVKDWRICLLGYSNIPDIYRPNQTSYAQGNEQQITNDIRSMRGSADLLIVSCHWGVEGMSYPSPHLVNQARSLIDAGADIILGHHPHVTQAVEHHGKGLICYSLGNFIFDLEWCPSLQRGAVVEIRIDPSGEKEYRFIPYEINQQFQPTPLVDQMKHAYLQELEQLKIPDLNGDIEQFCRDYQDDIVKVETSLAWRRHVFFWSNIWRGDRRAKVQFLMDKIKDRVSNFGHLQKGRK